MCIAFFVLQPSSELRLFIVFNRDEFLDRWAHQQRILQARMVFELTLCDAAPIRREAGFLNRCFGNLLRDGLHWRRPTLPLHAWEGSESPQLIGGQDVVNGGTWLALTRTGRFSFVTNFREVMHTASANRMAPCASAPRPNEGRPVRLRRQLVSRSGMQDA